MAVSGGGARPLRGVRPLDRQGLAVLPHGCMRLLLRNGCPFYPGNYTAVQDRPMLVRALIAIKGQEAKDSTGLAGKKAEVDSHPHSKEDS